MAIIGYETEFGTSYVIEAVHRECASLSDSDGVSIRDGDSECGKHRCAHCGGRIGTPVKRGHVSNPYRRTF